ncbi:MAG: bifunctional 3,4-dihydroxy-2-butanone-4-phosphate synthase/GTP cyclohydrolase II [Brevinema sp.]
MDRFNTIEQAIQDIKAGRMIVVIDDYDRENEGDLLMAAEKVTPEAINFMATHGKGLICMPCEKQLLEKLHIEPMVYNNTDQYSTAFTVSVDHVRTSTGISAADRALTIKEMLNPNAKPDDFRRPGHMFPLVSKSLGVLQREGHTEAAVDFARLAGFKPAGIICEIMKEDGTMMRVDDLMVFAKKYELSIVTIKDLVEYRKKREQFVVKNVVTTLPTKYGTFKIYGYVDQRTQQEHIALVMGDVSDGDPVLMRMHSECLTGDVFGSQRCDCGEQLDTALKNISEKGRGILLYLRQEGRGIGLINKLKTYVLQDNGADTVEANLQLGFAADLRDFSIANQMLNDLGVSVVDLMTNNPEKMEVLENYGVRINKRVPLELKYNKNNKTYLETKRNKLNHLLDILGE